jgi:hypothetical protein
VCSTQGRFQAAAEAPAAGHLPGLRSRSKQQEGAVSREMVGVSDFEAEYNKRRHSLARWHWGDVRRMRHVENQSRTTTDSASHRSDRLQDWHFRRLRRLAPTSYHLCAARTGCRSPSCRACAYLLVTEDVVVGSGLGASSDTDLRMPTACAAL